MANNTLPTSRVNSGPCSKDEYPTYPVDPGYEVHIPYEEPEAPCPCERTCEVNQCSNSDDEIYVENGGKEYTYGFTTASHRRAIEEGKLRKELDDQEISDQQWLQHYLKNGSPGSMTSYGGSTSNVVALNQDGTTALSATSIKQLAQSLPTLNIPQVLAGQEAFANKNYSEIVKTWHEAFAEKTIKQVHFQHVFAKDIDVLCYQMGEYGSLTLGLNVNKTTTYQANVRSELEATIQNIARATGGSSGRGGVNPNSSADANWKMHQWQVRNSVTHNTTERYHPCVSLRHEKVWEYGTSHMSVSTTVGVTVGGGSEVAKDSGYFMLLWSWNWGGSKK